MRLGTNKLRAAAAALVFSGALASAPEAKAVNLDELSKYLAFIEGFQHIFEYCQAETALPEPQIAYARNHIGERRALIFTGLHEIQRDRITADMPAKKAQMLKGVLEHIKKEQPGVPLKELCKQGFFEGVMESEQKSEANETAAISKAKN
jgi:hypothetical protein